MKATHVVVQFWHVRGILKHISHILKHISHISLTLTQHTYTDLSAHLERACQIVLFEHSIIINNLGEQPLQVW